MHGYLGNTDFDWYRFLRGQRQLDEVNFWQPGRGRPIHTVQSYEPFLFKLKAPHNAICGLGFLYEWQRLPAWFAWEAFGVRNGAPTRNEMYDRIARYRQGVQAGDPRVGSLDIGCLLITAPVFFPEALWVPQPRDWPTTAVQGKTYDLTHGEGRRVWEACRQAAIGLVDELQVAGSDGATVLETRARRLGQGTFRVAVTSAYEQACAVTREHSLPVLDAAHIRPFADSSDNRVSNGIALRSDLHRLFDANYITFDDDYRLVVSRRLAEEFNNGHTYYNMQGTRLWLPRDHARRPDPEALAWHREQFVG